MLKSGHCPEGGAGVPGLPKLLGALFKDLGISQRGGGVVGLPKLENLDF